MPLEIASLPPEVLHQILTSLPIPALLAFGQTSQYHHALQRAAFLDLRIGVFPSRITGLLALFDGASAADATGPLPYDAASSIHLTLDRAKHCTRASVIRKQNRTIAAVLRQHGRPLRSLDVALWSVEAPAADALAACPQLRHLAIRCDHPHTRHRDVDAAYWKHAPPSTAWNALYAPTGSRPTSRAASPLPSPLPRPTAEQAPAVPGRGSPPPTPVARLPSPPPFVLRPPVFTRLQSLTLERAGITTYQLQRLLGENARSLTSLRLRKCLQLGADFWAQLGAGPLAPRLRRLHFTESTHVEIDGRILEWVAAFTGLESFSLQGCLNIEDEEVERLNEEEWHFPSCTPPRCGEALETVGVDPAYK